MPHLAWLSDASGHIEFVNAPWVEYTGITLDALQDRMHAQEVVGIVHPDERALTVQAWEKALDEGRPYDIEYRLRRRSDNSYRWFIARALPIREDGEILGWIGTATDIDDERRVRETLEFVLEAEASLSATLDVASICRTFADIAIKGFADWCFVQLYVADRFKTIATAHRDAERQSEVERYVARAQRRPRASLLELLRNGPILVPSVTVEQLRAEAHDDEHFALMCGLNIHSVMIVPMFEGDGSLLGAITLIAAESMRTFSSDDLAVADRIAKRAQIALQTAQRFEQQRRIAERLQLLEAATQHVYDDRALNVAEMGRRIARAAVPALADRVSIYLRDGREQPDRLRFLAVYDVDERMTEGDTAPHETYPLSTSTMLGSVIEQNRPLLVPEVDETILRELSDDAAFIERLRRFGLRSFVIVPLRGASGPFGAIILSMCRDTVRRFSEDDIPVAEELAARTAFAIDLAIRNERDRRVSETFQQAALPAELPRIPGLALSAWYEAGGNDAQVGGDWYDAFRLPDGRLVLSIGDVAGSGLDAAVIMGSVRQSIRTAAIITPEPRLILDAVDRVVRALGERFVTAFVAIFDPLFGELRYASAGHAAALLRTPDGSVEELRTSGLPLGLRNLAPGGTKSRTLSAHSRLLLFTDGLSEVDRDIVAGERRIREVFGGGTASARTLFTGVMDGRQTRDDVAIILLTFERSPLASSGPHGAAQWTFETANSQAGTDVRRQLRRFLGEHGLGGGELDQAEIVSGELIGNAVRYAPGKVNVIADASGALPVLHVIDEGPGWELNPRLPADVMSERGRGLFIINAFVEEMSISRRTDAPGSHARVVLCTVAR